MRKLLIYFFILQKVVFFYFTTLKKATAFYLPSNTKVGAHSIVFMYGSNNYIEWWLCSVSSHFFSQSYHRSCSIVDYSAICVCDYHYTEFLNRHIHPNSAGHKKKFTSKDLAGLAVVAFYSVRKECNTNKIIHHCNTLID